MTPTEELRAAAVKVREMAAKATPGPWTLYDRGVCWELNELDEHDGTCFREGDARWISLMGPDNADAFATALEIVANCVSWTDKWENLTNVAVIRDSVRAINGGER